MRLGQRIVLMFLAVSLLFSLMGYLILQAAQGALYDAIGRNYATLSVSTMDQLDLQFASDIETFETIANRPRVIEAVEDSNKAFESMDGRDEYISAMDLKWAAAPKDEMSPLIEGVLNHPVSNDLRDLTAFFEHKYGYSRVGEIFVTNRYGVNVLSTGRTSDFKQDDESWWHDGLAGPVVEDLEMDESSGLYSTSFIVPVYGKNGSIIGILKAVVNAQEIFKILKRAANESDLDIDLYDQSGALLFSTKNDTKIRLSDPKVLAKYVGDSGYAVKQPADGGPSDILAFARPREGGHLKRLGWLITMDVPEESVSAPINRLGGLIIGVSLLTALSATVLGVYTSLSISRPLRILRDKAKLIGQGDLKQRYAEKSDLELTELGDSFNSMASQLETNNEELKRHAGELEDRVFERTRDLSVKVEELNRTHMAVLNMLEDLQAAKNELDEKVKSRTKELQKAYDELRDSDKVKDDFLAITSHELKTPLTSIIGLTQLIRDELAGKLSPDEVEDIRIVLEEANRLKKLIEEILELARLDAGKKMFNMTELDVGKIISEVTYELKAFTEQNDVNVTVVESKVPTVLGDHDSVKRLLYNLVNNAIKYSLNEGLKTVEISACSEGGEVVCSVRDNGIGIPQAAWGKIFSRFYQVDSSASRKYGGTGLGLAICKKIVDAHKGRIWFDSKVGAGTTFYFSLPAFAGQGGGTK